MESRREAEALLGETIEGKYRIEALVGRGGFGLVYRARHLIWNQPVAIKFLTRLSNVPEEARAEVLAFFVREGRLLSELSSKTTGIVQARDIGTMTTPTGRWMPYMVLEWLEGQPLGRVLRREAAEGRTRSVLEAFRVFDGVARALAIAHQSGVAHRDIKPPNIFLCGDALEPGVTVKLLDFGIAKVMQDHSGEAFETTGGAMIFTPHYGAPEQFNRKLGVSGPWTDVYAMTLVFLELVTGARVRTGESVGELAVECMDDARRPTPRALGVEVSDAVEAVLSRALAVQIEERFQSMGALWMALAAALELEAYPPLPAAREDSVVTAAISDPGTSLTGAELSGGLSTLQALDSRGFEPVHTETVAPLPARAGPRRSVALVGGLSALVVAVTSVALLGDDPPAPAAPASSPAVVEVDEPAAPLVVTPPAAPRSPCPEGMSPITGGPFYMGTDLEDVPALAMARPAHQVTVADFCLDVREVTVAEYRACSDVGECKRAFLDSSWPQGSTPRREWKAQRAAHSPLCNAGDPARDDHPVNCVTWAQADKYCRFLGKRLPREREWEFAARGSDGRVFPWGDAPPSPERVNGCGRECVAWRRSAGLSETPTLYDVDDGFHGTAPVGSFPAGATADGLLDIIGNVFEWTDDAYRPYDDDAAEPDPAYRVIRGGAFNSFQPEHANPALRYPMAADAHSHGIGFRCAVELERSAPSTE